VTWYKDGIEFFKFMPAESTPFRDYNINGLRVDLSKSDSNQVTLLGLNNGAQHRFTKHCNRITSHSETKLSYKFLQQLIITIIVNKS